MQSSADDLKAKIAELKAKVEEMPIEDRSSLFSQIDKLEKDVLERYEQALNEVMPVVSNCDRENDWDHLQFAEPFARIAVAEEKAESSIPLAKYVDDIEETYWFCIDHLWLHPNIRCIYRKNMPELPIPRHPEHDKKWISMRKRDFPEHNLYVPVKEYDLRMEHDAESYYVKEPLRRNR